MKKKILTGFFALILLLTPVVGRGISLHSIDITTDETGQGHVVEHYYFTFDNAKQLERMRSDARRLGADIAAWRAFDQNIYPHIGQIKPGTGKIGFEEKEGDRFVTIEYETRTPLFSKVESPRKTSFQLDSGLLSAFQTGSVYTIPPNTKLILTVPRNAKFDSTKINPMPEINFEANRFIWSGYLNTTGNFEFEYYTEKQIAPSISVSQSLQSFISTNEFKLLFAMVLLAMGFVYFKRNSIQKKIEKYVIDNSAPEKNGETEPVELD